jgi:hypothetical protein
MAWIVISAAGASRHDSSQFWRISSSNPMCVKEFYGSHLSNLSLLSNKPKDGGAVGLEFSMPRFLAMKRVFEKDDLWLGGMGLVMGLICAVLWEYKVVTEHRLWALPLIGALIGVLILPAYRWLISGARGVRVKSAKVKIPALGELEVEITDVHRAVGWNIFVEASTRITTQRLGEEGFIREALTSLYGLFTIVRTELKRMSPSPPPSKAGVYTVESYALRMLNDGLRPMLARWHPRLQQWEQTGKPESVWPLAPMCRNDLEVTRTRVSAYVHGLGAMLDVHDLEHVLGPESQATEAELRQRWTSDQDLTREMGKLDPLLSATETSVAWHLYVELVSSAAMLPSTQTADIRGVLTSLDQLCTLIREELKRLAPIVRSVTQTDQGKTIEAIALSILREHLHPFLAKWHPKLANWERQANKTEDVWSEAQACQQEFEKARLAITEDTSRLGKLMGIQQVILPVSIQSASSY